MHIVVAGPICGSVAVRRLAFPYPVSVDLYTDGVQYAARGLSRPLRSGRHLTVPALARFDLQLAAGAAVSIQVNWGAHPQSIRGSQLPVQRPHNFRRIDEANGVATCDKPWTLALARAVFMHPQSTWTREAFAALVNISSGNVSRLLFSEGESFRDIVRAYRVCRLLCDLPTHRRIDNGLADAYGFSYLYVLEDAVYQLFNVSLTYLWSLVSAGERADGR